MARRGWRRILDLPEEIQFFGRLAGYGIAVGGAYYVLTQEIVGGILLVGFGVATGVVTWILLAGRGRQPVAGGEREGPDGTVAGTAPDGPFGDETGRVPAPSLAPLEFGFGVALASLAFVFGPPMAVAAVVPLVAGARGWLRGASAEWAAMEREAGGQERDLETIAREGEAAATELSG